MNINKLPIFNPDGRKLCHITHKDDSYEWVVHTGDGETITTLMLGLYGFHANFESPCDEFDTDGGMEYHLNTTDGVEELCPDPGSEECTLRDKCIRSAAGKLLCKLSFNGEDHTWGVAFAGEPFNTTLYLYYNGSYTQVEMPAEVRT